jgi:uncharacterized damage-inducible protein DinB
VGENSATLETFYENWKLYQDLLTTAIAPLSAEQLALRPAPGMRSIGENVLHVVGCRAHWLTDFLGENGGEAMRPYVHWNAVALGRASLETPLTAAELVQGLDRTWQFLASCLARWSSADMQRTFPDERDGRPIELPRAWVVWHVLEHDLHHGGEISLTLGMHGLHAPDI